MNYRDEISGNIETIKPGEEITVEKLIESIERTLFIVDANETKIVIHDKGECGSSYQFIVGLSAKVEALKYLIENPTDQIIKN